MTFYFSLSENFHFLIFVQVKLIDVIIFLAADFSEKWLALKETQNI